LVGEPEGKRPLGKPRRRLVIGVLQKYQNDKLKEHEIIQGDQKVFVHLMITVKKKQKYFKQFQSLTVIT
jgi:Neuraminidase (sialidase)